MGIAHTFRRNAILIGGDTVRTTQNQTADQVVHTPRELAKMLRVAPGTVYRALRRGEIPSISVGRLKLIPAAMLERFLSGMADPTARDE